MHEAGNVLTLHSLRKLIGAQHEEVMARHEETMAYLRQREEEMREEFRQRKEESKRLAKESERRTEETREFNREILLRNEKVYTSVIAQLEKSTAQMHSSIEETRAQTQALLRLIDRFDEPGGAAVA